jgi:hypothetical protein
MLYILENPVDFDNLEGRDVAQFVRYITHQYYVTYNWFPEITLGLKTGLEKSLICCISAM